MNLINRQIYAQKYLKSDRKKFAIIQNKKIKNHFFNKLVLF